MMRHDTKTILAAIDEAQRTVRDEPETRISVAILGGATCEGGWIETVSRSFERDVEAIIHDEVDGRSVVTKVPVDHVMAVTVTRAAPEGDRLLFDTVPPSRRTMALRSVILQLVLGIHEIPTFANVCELLDEIDGSGSAYAPSDKAVDQMGEAMVGEVDKILVHLLTERNDTPPRLMDGRLAMHIMRDAEMFNEDLEDIGALMAADGNMSSLPPGTQKLIVARARLASTLTDGTRRYHPFIQRQRWMEILRDVLGVEKE